MENSAAKPAIDTHWLAEFKDNIGNQFKTLHDQVAKSTAASEKALAEVQKLQVHHARLAAQIYEITGNGKKGKLDNLQDFVGVELAHINTTISEHTQQDEERFDEIHAMLERREWTWPRVARAAKYVTSIGAAGGVLIAIGRFVFTHSDVLAGLLRN